MICCSFTVPPPSPGYSGHVAVPSLQETGRRGQGQGPQGRDLPQGQQCQGQEDRAEQEADCLLGEWGSYYTLTVCVFSVTTKNSLPRNKEEKEEEKYS